MEMNPIVSVSLLAVFDKVSWVALFLTDPTPPQVQDTSLVRGRADDFQGVEIYRSFNDIGGISLYSFTEDGVPLEQDILQHVILVRLRFDSVQSSE